MPTPATYLVVVYVCDRCADEMTPYEYGLHNECCANCGCENIAREERREVRVEPTDAEAETRLAEIRARDVFGTRTETPTPEQVAAREALFSILDCDDVGPQTAEPTYQEGALFRRQAS